MRKWIKLLEAVIVVSLIVISFISINSINQLRAARYSGSIDKAHHFAIVTDEVSSYAFNKFIEGIDSIIDDHDAVFEVYEVGVQSSDAIFDMIQLTEVDGVILKLSNNNAYSSQINAFKANGINVVAIGNDAPESDRDLYVGTNKFQLGKEAAALSALATDRQGRVAVILGNEYLDDKAVATNNFVNGLYEGVKDYNSLSISTIQYSTNLRAEIIVDEILGGTETIDVIICTDPLDVNRVMRVLVDRNMVGSIKVIANGNTPEIVEYIRKNLVYASLVEDYEELGRLSIEYLDKLNKEQVVSSYINIPIATLKKDNLEEVQP